MNPMVPGLSGGKMSSSDPKSKVDYLDSVADIKSKLKAAVCTPGDVEGNGVLAFVRTVLIPVQELRDEQARDRGEKSFTGEGSFAAPGAPEGTVFSIVRPEKFGGNVHFSSYQALEQAYAKEEIHPGDLKGAVTEALISLLTPIRKIFEESPEWQEVERLGYPGQSVQVALDSAKPGAGNKTDGKIVRRICSTLIEAADLFRRPRWHELHHHPRRREPLCGRRRKRRRRPKQKPRPAASQLRRS